MAKPKRTSSKRKLDKETGLINYGWVRDPTVKMKHQQGGHAPAGHVRRCQGKVRCGTQCPHWAKQGRDFCRKHGGNQPMHAQRNTPLVKYSRFAGKALKEILKQAREDETPESRHSLAQEIDMARVAAGQAIKAFDAVCFPENEAIKEKISDEARGIAARLVHDAMASVADIVAKAAKVRSVHESTFDVEMLDYVVTQVMRVLESNLKDQPELYIKITEDLREIAMPERKRKGQTAALGSAEDIRTAMREMEELEEQENRPPQLT